METIKNILQIDSEFRKSGVTDDLFTLEQLQVEHGWNYELPTLVKDKEYTEIKYERNIKKIVKKFYEKYRIFFDIDFNNLLIAGGSVMNLLFDERGVKDIDIFIYGLKDEKSATEKISSIIKQFYLNILKIKKGRKSPSDNKMTHEEIVKLHNDEKHMYDKNISKKIDVIYNGNTVSVFVDGLTIQFILRLYKTKSEILHGFDLGSSSIGFDGSQIYFTTLSKFCYENMVNIFDGTRRSTTYEIRLVKYFNKGFSIILPNLDVGKLDRRNLKYNLLEVCELPYFVFSYENVNNNIIHVTNFYNINNNNVLESDYTFCDCDDIDNHKLSYYNLTSIIKKDNKYIYLNHVSNELEALLDKNGNLDNWNKITFDNKILKYDFVLYVYNGLHKNMKKGYLNITNIKKYFNVVSLDKFLSIYAEENSEKKLQELFDLQIEEIKRNLKKIENVDLVWKIENPGTQLTSSFNPIIEDDKLWYGKFFKNRE